MKRDLTRFSGKVYDVLVIGGGINGVATAWDAALRGLSVGLLERGDFGHATSSATLKLIHGGLRYLQHLEFGRVRESIRERRTMMRIAPHLVGFLPFLIPTYGHGMRGREAFALAMFVNRLMSLDQRALDHHGRRIPDNCVISKEECLRIVPGIRREGLTGGAVYFDSQMYSPERLTLSFAMSAAHAGADVANYAEVTGFLADNGRVRGVTARDAVTGDAFDVRARVIVNMTGPWTDIVLDCLKGFRGERRVLRSKGIQMVAPLLVPDFALGVEGKQRDPTLPLSRHGRLLFITPWRGRSLIGTTDTVFEGDPDHFAITERDIAKFIEEINEAYPAARLKREDVTFWFGGLRPITEKNIDPAMASQAVRKYEIRDHARGDGIQNLVSAVGIKYTTCRRLAERVVDLVFHKLGTAPPRATTAETPLAGGAIESFDEYMGGALRANAKAPANARLPESVVRHLVHSYGTEYGRILDEAARRPDLGETVPGSAEVLKAEVIHAVREEMALRLTDVVLRRTDLGTLGHPGEAALKACAEVMAQELGWNEATVGRNLDEVRAAYRTA